jgi:hypothetical protein
MTFTVETEKNKVAVPGAVSGQGVSGKTNSAPVAPLKGGTTDPNEL